MVPAMALYAAVEMLLGKKKFQPPFSTRFAAMLLAGGADPQCDAR